MGCGSSANQIIQDTIKNVEFNRTVEISNLSLSRQPYFDLLMLLAKNKNCVNFKMKNVEISKLSILIFKFRCSKVR